MRQLFIKTPEGYGHRVLDLAGHHGGMNLAQQCVRDKSGRWDLVIVQIPNHQVGPLLDAVDFLPEVQITLIPTGVLAMAPPKTQVAEEITDVSPLSPIEIWLNGLQSIGSWKGFLGYTVAASFVVWVGMFTNTIYLLVAAMLIAPFAGPAMNIAIATASGDPSLLWRNLLRYTASIICMIATTAALSLILRLQTATSTMVNISELSSVAVFLPLAAGAAGALNLVQAERSSLVSGTAVGLLVAASLAPPAGLIGMAGALGRWSMVFNGAFTLLLQLVAINLGGAVVLRIYGLNTDGARYQRGFPWLFRSSLATTVVLLAAMLIWQFWSLPDLQRSTVAGRAVALVEEIVNESDFAQLIEANVRFTRPSSQDQETLLGVIYVQRRSNVLLSDEEIRTRLASSIATRLRTLGQNVVPLIDVTVLDE